MKGSVKSEVNLGVENAGAEKQEIFDALLEIGSQALKEYLQDKYPVAQTDRLRPQLWQSLINYRNACAGHRMSKRIRGNDRFVNDYLTFM